MKINDDKGNLPAMFRGKGWLSWQDLMTATFYAKIDTPAKMRRFKRWRDKDGRRSTLLKFGTVANAPAKKAIRRQA